ncbi:MAG: SDR family NAD(P)-dependent oxidoreductase [Spongiibacteraceae bacterium]|nr:SDR family NAD(P)-dependent oxidoreductase [Spongiibacteraceae bacterium]
MTNTKKQLAGDVAIVTGAGSGFGRAIALALAGAGAAVAVMGRRAAPIEAVAKEINETGGRAIAVTCDVVQRAQVEAAVRTTEQQLGAVSILVNNAGLASPYGPIGFADPDVWWSAHAVHVRGPLLFMSALIPGMRERGRGRIINVASRGGTRIEPHLSAYAVGKATEIRLTEHVDAENREYGVRAFAIQPGDAVTDLAHSTLSDPDAQRWVPGMLKVLEEWLANAPDPQPVLNRCGEFCVDLASGRLDALAGRYLDPEFDIEAMLAEAQQEN